MDQEYFKTILCREIATELSMEPEAIDENATFMRLGVSSVQALKVVNRLRKQLGIDINPVALFEFKTIEEFSGYLADEAA